MYYLGGFQPLGDYIQKTIYKNIFCCPRVKHINSKWRAANYVFKNVEFSSCISKCCQYTCMLSAYECFYFITISWLHAEHIKKKITFKNKNKKINKKQQDPTFIFRLNECQFSSRLLHAKIFPPRLTAIAVWAGFSSHGLKNDSQILRGPQY